MSFKLTTLGNFAKIQGGYAYKSSDFLADGTWPVLKIKNIRAGHVEYESVSYVDEDIAEATKKWRTEPGDILISMTGSGPSAPDSLVGRVAKVWKSDPPAQINQRVGRLCLKDGEKIDSDFLFYLLSWTETQQ
jgi:type I restriction enzyme S subunit